MIQIDDYKLEYLLGKGEFSDVFYTTKKGSNEIFATKRVEKEKALSEKMKSYFLNEIDILKNTNHQNLIKLHEIKNSPNNFYLIMEFCNGGTLNEIFEKYFDSNMRAFPEIYVQHILRQVSCGLYYLHKSNIIHRDLKMENILLHYDFITDAKEMNILKSKLKIIDFGFAKYLNDSASAHSICGSPINMDPVILKALAFKQIGQNFGYTEKADMWSLGIMVYTLLIGKPPFIASNYKDLYKQINEGNYEIPKKLKLSKQSISLINGLLQYEHAERLSIDELVFHEFLTLDVKEFELCELNKIDKLNGDILLNSKEDIKKIWDNYQAKDNNVNLGNIRGNLSKKSFIEEIDTNYKYYDSNKNKSFQSLFINEKNDIVFTNQNENCKNQGNNNNNLFNNQAEIKIINNINTISIPNTNTNTNPISNLILKNSDKNFNEIQQRENYFNAQKEKINQINKIFDNYSNSNSNNENNDNLNNYVNVNTNRKDSLKSINNNIQQNLVNNNNNNNVYNTNSNQTNSNNQGYNINNNNYKTIINQPLIIYNESIKGINNISNNNNNTIITINSNSNGNSNINYNLNNQVDIDQKNLHTRNLSYNLAQGNAYKINQNTNNNNNNNSDAYKNNNNNNNNNIINNISNINYNNINLNNPYKDISNPFYIYSTSTTPKKNQNENLNNNNTNTPISSTYNSSNNNNNTNIIPNNNNTINSIGKEPYQIYGSSQNLPNIKINNSSFQTMNKQYSTISNFHITEQNPSFNQASYNLNNYFTNNPNYNDKNKINQSTNIEIENTDKNNKYTNGNYNNFSSETNYYFNKFLINNNNDNNTIMRTTNNNINNNQIINSNEFIQKIEDRFKIPSDKYIYLNENQINNVRNLKNYIDDSYDEFKGFYSKNENQISKKLFFILSDIKSKIEEAEDLINKNIK
jgi:serine/threonine protein kinase